MPAGGGIASSGGGGGSGSFGALWSGRYGKVGRLCALLLLIIVLLSIIVPLATRMSKQNVDIATDFYSPGDSRLLSLSSFFCDGGVLMQTPNTVDADLYRVGSTPPLNDTNNFTVTEHSSFDPLEFHFWQYHLYQNSTITLSVSTDYFIDVYIIKSKANANYWSTSPSEESYKRIGSISNVLYKVQQEDEYFILLHNSLQSRTVLVTATLTFERYEYSPPVMLMVMRPALSVSKVSVLWEYPMAQGHKHF